MRFRLILLIIFSLFLLGISNVYAEDEIISLSDASNNDTKYQELETESNNDSLLINDEESNTNEEVTNTNDNINIKKVKSSTNNIESNTSNNEEIDTNKNNEEESTIIDDGDYIYEEEVEKEEDPSDEITTDGIFLSMGYFEPIEEEIINPNTSDNIYKYIDISIISLLSIIFLIVLRNRLVQN